MASSIGAGRTRALLWAVAALAFLAVLVDAGSCTIARMQVDEDAKTAARHAVQQIAGSPVNQETALIAYSAATSALPNKNETIITNGPGDKEDFRLGADGSITMTVTRSAPTVVFKYLPKLKDFTIAKSTHTQAPLG